MQWPTLIVDNFFADPNAVVKLSKTFKYDRAENHKWPGTRTLPMHTVDKNFFLWSTKKIMALLYPMNLETVRWEAAQQFQRVPFNTHGEEGWVHIDTDYELTTIIYLSHHPQSGTCLYEGKHFGPLPEVLKYRKEKERFIKDLKDRKRMEKYKNKNNSNFRKKIELFSNFNRLVLFDGHNWHASKNSGADKSERLTLITFFKDITCKDIRYPIPQMRRI